MKKIIVIVGILFFLTGCGNKEKEKEELGKDSRGLYLISDYFSLYSDEENLMFNNMSMKEFFVQSNCTPECIHNYSEPIDILDDGGTEIYEFQLNDDRYYFIECHKTDSKYNEGRDILIGKDKDKLVKLC